MRQILTIVANPQTFKLQGSFLKEFDSFLAQKAQIVSYRDLAIEVAVEYELISEGKGFKKDIANYLDGISVDFFLRSKKSFSTHKKLFISDMDATLIQNECIDEMAREIGKGEEIEKITAQSMEGNLVFESSLDLRVSLLKGMDVNLLKKIYDEVITLTEGVETVAKTLKTQGIKSVIVSGGFTHFTNHLRNQLAFDYDFANVLEVKNEKLTGKVIPPMFGPKDKLRALKGLMESENVSMEEIVGIGDGANDLPFLTFIDNGIGYKAKKLVRGSLDYNIIHTDFTSVLYFLGIKKSDFSKA